MKILAGLRSNDNLNSFIGGHSLNSVLSNVGEYGSRITHTNGVIEIRPLAGASPTGGAASIYFTDYTNTVFWKKDTHTYFPAHLSDAEILSEIVSAFQHQTRNGVQSWEGISSNGLKIAGSIDRTTGLINSAFPVP